MATLLKACFSNHGNKYLFKIKNLAFNTKNGNFKTEVLASFSNIRHCTSKATETSAHESQEPRVIYTGELQRQLKNLKVFSLSTSGFAFFGWPVYYYCNETTSQFIPFLTAMVTFYAIGTPLLLHMIAKKYVIEMEYAPKSDTYFLTTYNILCMKKKMEFTPDDVERPMVQGAFSIVEVKGKPVFFDIYNFIEPDHCARILGYDKPIDFKLNEIEDEVEEQKKSLKQ